ncbi:hypothetical protein [Roseimicrobium sp. ORNL1]|uniref:hypothetical protein n=1 Tax=Roseimicrobium sp. ORNL1 TaxID=2711231 RepID=UPI0013E1DA27|nr:hypothetical protein [Roseimicrobium sp. ORNL1]QIF01713.1 hypothetical protein G5S37_09310 [Roseimicrobium sp. ORNL1]
MAKVSSSPAKFLYLLFRWLACGLLLVGGASCTLSSRTRACIDSVGPSQNYPSDIWCSWVARYRPVFDADPLFLLEKETGKNSKVSLRFTQPDGTVDHVVLREVQMTPSRRGAKSVILLEDPTTIRLVSHKVDPRLLSSLRKALELPSGSVDFPVDLKPRPYPYVVRVAGEWVSKNGTRKPFDRQYTIKISWRMALLRGAHSPAPSYNRPHAKRPKHKKFPFG